VTSLKTYVIEQLFLERFNPRTELLRKDIVTLQEVSEAIDKWGEGLSTRNPANFFKDIVRSSSRNRVFPDAVTKAGWTARQDPGEGRCFRFVPLPAGQTSPFPATDPDPNLVQHPHPVQSLSLPSASRQFGRPHETWLTHVVTNLGIVHAHLGLHSPLDFLAIELLQSNVELGQAEVDAIYLGELQNRETVLISCEMKGAREVLDEDQIERGSSRVAATSGGTSVIPLGVKTLKGGLVWIVEFDRDERPLKKVSEGVYRLIPSVPGIG
jgi:hypothetical protein